MRRPLVPILIGSLLATVASVGSGSGESQNLRTSPGTSRSGSTSPALAKRSPTGAKVEESYGKLPLAFEPNRGQAPPSTGFLARGAGYEIALQASRALFSLGGRDSLRMKLIGASKRATLVPGRRLPGKVNYLFGNDPSGWVTGLPTYARITARNVYPGIDLSYYGRQGKLEYDFVLAPGADAKTISVRFAGARGIKLDRSGSLVIDLAKGTLRQAPPRIYQRIDGVRRPVEGRFVLRRRQVGFAIGAYDRSRELVIDPTLDYSTYLGGSGADQGYAIAVRSGSAYVSGITTSTNFPTAVPFQAANAGGSNDVFVTKLSTSGSAILYSTYLGGSGDDQSDAIAVDSAGSAYLSGWTDSSNFPTAGAYDTTKNGFQDAFVAKLAPSGSALVYSTYLGGNSNEQGTGIAVDSGGSAYITGVTSSTDFPKANPFQATMAGFGDAFVTKFSPNGATLVYSTYVGGNSEIEQALAIAIDSAGSAYITGQTDSTSFPTVLPAQAAKSGFRDAFVTKLAPSGSALVYSTYLGGGQNDLGRAIAVDGAGSAYVGGETASGSGFPIVNASQGTYGGSTFDAFVTKFDPNGAFAYSTYLGGESEDRAYGIAVDGIGSALVTGYTLSSSFPLMDPYQPLLNRGGGGSGADAFVTQFAPNGSALMFSTYLGGESYDNGYGIAVDGSGTIYVSGSVGATSGLPFPIVNAYQATYGGGVSDAFAARFSGTPPWPDLRALEVNQAVQTWKNAIPLVKDKETAVRAFVRTRLVNGAETVIGRLHGTRGGAALPGSPLAAINPAATITAGPDPVATRGQLASSLNFLLPLSWRHGTVELRFELAGTGIRCFEPAGPGSDPAGDCTVTVTFTQQPRPRIVLVPVPYLDGGGATVAPTIAQTLEQMFRVQSAFPTDDVTVELDSLDAFASKPLLKDVNAKLAKKRELDTSATCPLFCRSKAFRYYGVLAGTGTGDEGGLANDVPGQVASGYLEGAEALTANGYARNRAAHELGHVYGRHHAVDDAAPVILGKKQGQCGERGALTAPAHTPFETVGGNRRPVLGTLSAGPDEEVWGLDTRFLYDSSSSLVVVDPRKTFELMSYCDGTGDGTGTPKWKWPSKYTYEGLIGSIPSGAARQAKAVASTSATGDFVLVHGLVDFVGNAATLKPTTFGSGTFDVPVSGTYRAQLLDANDQEIVGTDFEPVVMDAEGQIPGQPTGPPVGLVLVPLQPPQPAPPVARIVILHNGVPIGSATASANPPTAAIVAPTTGSSFTGPTVTFDWDASDPDPGQLFSTVLYSANGGTSWNTLAVDHTTTQLTVARSALIASTDARLRVVVSDGVRTTSAESGAFTVGNNAPDVVITSPPNGHQFTSEQTITLEGFGLDREDGSLNAAIDWTSDLDGPLGTGSSISVPASGHTEGTHLITATATDSQGASGAATITIDVGGSPTRVTLTNFTARRSRAGVVVRWRTASETDVAGFNLYRGSVRVNRRLIHAKGGMRGAAYRFVDRGARGAAAYRLQVVSLGGTRTWRGTARVRH